MNVKTEKELIALLNEQSENGLKYLYHYYSGSLLLIIGGLVADAHLAENIVQDVFVKIWLNFSRYDPEKGTLYTWMVAIARNTAIDFLRRTDTNRRFEAIERQAGMPETRKYSAVDAIGLYRLIMRLPVIYQPIMVNIYLRGYTHKETAALMNLPEGTVKTRSRQALRLLRLHFESVSNEKY